MAKLSPTQLLRFISETDDPVKAEIAFQEFQFLIETRFAKAFYASCWKFFRADQKSVLVENIYGKVLTRMYSDLRNRKFVLGTYVSEEGAIVHAMKWMLNKVMHIGLKELERKKSAAEKLHHALVDLADEHTEEHEMRLLRMERAIALLSAKDQQILKIYFLTTDITKLGARELLMKKYRIPSTNAFSRAKGEAIGRLRKLLQHESKKKGVPVKRETIKKRNNEKVRKTKVQKNTG